MSVYYRSIICCGCNGKKVQARLTNGVETYPHRPDLSQLPFWKCDKCNNFVGCHHKTKDRTRPLGCIPTPELKEARKHIHALLDRIWGSGKMGRRQIWKYHTAQITTVEEARKIYKIILEYS